MSDVQAVLFDLDGTLIDTAGDLLGALDDLRSELGLPACTVRLPLAVAARGGRGIISLGFPDDATAADRFLPRYLELYRLRIARLSRPYAGIETMLATLRERGTAFGIVTNKPEGLARVLLDELGWSRDLVMVGGDTLPVRKPAPDPVWHACKLLGVLPERSIMVGDDRRDIESGRAAGCWRSIAVSYGYIENPAELATWQADHLVDSPEALAALLLALT